jgi:signal transduction histidine kinase
MFLLMVAQTGGAVSDYYVGLILLVIGMGVLAPLTWRQGAVIASVMFAGYAALPLYTHDPLIWSEFSQHLFFFGAACLEAVWACAYMDRMRFADFKQQRELEKARDDLAQLDRAKSRFSANVHHELRTPLTLILAPLDAMRGGELGELPEQVERTLDTMHSNGRRLYKMINNLLDLSKLESNQFEVRRRPVELARLVEEVVIGARALSERKGVELCMSGFEHLPTINADPDALEKVLVNLVGNALKFTDEGDRIEVHAEHLGSNVVMSVADTGIGIAPQKLDSIFDRFAQIDGSATRRYEGTGIGLSLAREMVTRHDGRIWATSKGEGCGTTIWVELPIGEPDAFTEEDVLRSDEGELLGVGRSIDAVEADLGLGAAEESSEPFLEMERSVERWEGSRGPAGGEQPDPPADSPEVLIAEDNPDMRALLKMLVGREFRLRIARNGREALEMVRERAPDLILSDVMMPEMSGIELCKAIKAEDATRAIPVVLVTSKAEQDMKIEGLELGADDYVTKPFHPRELLARVRSLVRVRSLQKQLSHRNEDLERTLRELQAAEVQLVQSERLAAVGELAAGIAHEVNNPLNFALNAARAMGSTLGDLSAAMGDGKAEEGEDVADLAETIAELSQIIVEGLNRTHALVGDLRDFATPRRRADLVPIDLERGLRSTIALLGHTLSEHRAEVSLDSEPGFPLVEADASGLNQVFLNLIKNAAEAFGGQGGEIRIELRRESDGHGVAVTISDDGPGISDNHIHRLFEPFFTTKEVGQGTGLGLSISRQIVDAHGGRLEVEGNPEGGARFVIHLPVTAPTVGPRPDAHEASAAG